MVTKVCILGIEAFFLHFLNKNTEKIIQICSIFENGG